MKQNLQEVSNTGSQLSRLALSHGKRTRLWRLLYGHGPRNGSLLVLPLDQGLEHGPTDFFPHPPAVDPELPV
jgi:class I fructose-bisphosphate aldolase